VFRFLPFALTILALTACDQGLQGRATDNDFEFSYRIDFESDQVLIELASVSRNRICIGMAEWPSAAGNASIPDGDFIVILNGQTHDFIEVGPDSDGGLHTRFIEPFSSIATSVPAQKFEGIEGFDEGDDIAVEYRRHPFYC